MALLLATFATGDIIVRNCALGLIVTALVGIVGTAALRAERIEPSSSDLN